MAGQLDDFMDFMEEEDGFETPLMPSREHPEGRRYRVPSPDAITGLRLSAVSDIALKQRAKVEVSEHDIRRLRLDDDDEREFMQQVLGTALDDMLADGCRWEHIRRMGAYAFTRFTISAEAADEAAERGLFSGKAPTPVNRAERRATGARSGRPASRGSRTPRA